jgi:uncharacterized protein (TIGR02594 family)
LPVQAQIEHVQLLASKVFINDTIRAQLAVAQAVQESNLMSGKMSGLASKANNLFGLKGKGNDGSLSMKTKEYYKGNFHTITTNFAKYKSQLDSMVAYQKLLTHLRYYSVMKADTFDEAADAIQNDGYSTDPKYAKQLIEINNNIHPESTIHKILGYPYKLASKFLGLGKNSNPKVLKDFFRKYGITININNTPWCAAFVNGVLAEAGYSTTHSLAAKSFLMYGKSTKTPHTGDIVVYNRKDKEHGHVGFVESIIVKNGKQYVRTLGGNQGHKVSIKDYPITKVASFRTIE